MGRRFKFRLQPLLDLRARIEERNRQAYAAQLHERDEALQQAHRLNRELHAAAIGGCSVAECGRIDAAISARRRYAAAMHGALARARDDLMAASRDRRVLEKLRERQQRRHDNEEGRREEIEQDECNAGR
jgi:flagellar FliJ protein